VDIVVLAYAGERRTVSSGDAPARCSVFPCRMKEDIQTAPGG
jgi:hypothetical protein